jgi:hypothetical protein
MRLSSIAQVATLLILVPLGACQPNGQASGAASYDGAQAPVAAIDPAPAVELVACDVLPFDATSPAVPVGRLEVSVPPKTSTAPVSYRLYARDTGALVGDLDDAVDLYNRQGRIASVSGLTSDAKGEPVVSLRAFFSYEKAAAPAAADAPAVDAPLVRKGHAELNFKPLDPAARVLVKLQCN